MNDMNQ